ncbi:hypothetical protein [Paracoccus binzhouensis]|uniref:hypothetical protein n=1 Tax=Paracoccus binzhouensis TaxID=2796149 RepID=UPI0018EF2AE5|nr:hypothetical protein [Paracoccus binzhouensis]
MAGLVPERCGKTGCKALIRSPSLCFSWNAFNARFRASLSLSSLDASRRANRIPAAPGANPAIGRMNSCKTGSLQRLSSGFPSRMAGDCFTVLFTRSISDLILAASS